MEGNLINGQGAPFQETLQPIQVPPFREIYVREDGKLLIEPITGEPGVTQLIGSIGLVSTEGLQLRKDDDGKSIADGSPIVTDQINVKQGYIEESNVNVIDELVASMGYQRSYEMNPKLIKMASELDQVPPHYSECQVTKKSLLFFFFTHPSDRLSDLHQMHKPCNTPLEVYLSEVLICQLMQCM